MKKILIVAAVAAVAACSKPAPAPEAADTAAPAAATPATGSLAADGKSSDGTFKVTNADGKTITEVDKPDGTYTDTDASGKVTETGKWNQKSPTEFCFTKDGGDGKEVCNTEGVDAKGVWTSKSPDGKVATVVRVEG
jgi:hypothetical protein